MIGHLYMAINRIWSILPHQDFFFFLHIFTCFFLFQRCKALLKPLPNLNKHENTRKKSQGSINLQFLDYPFKKNLTCPGNLVILKSFEKAGAAAAAVFCCCCPLNGGCCGCCCEANGGWPNCCCETNCDDWGF